MQCASKISINLLVQKMFIERWWNRHLDGPVGGDGTYAEDGRDEDDVGDGVEQDCAQDSGVTHDVSHS